VDEAMCGSHKRYAAQLKTLITELRHTVQNKYAPPLSIDSFANFIMASNEDHVVTMEHKDRRYFALQTDNKWSGVQSEEKAAYFAKLRAVPVHAVAKYLYEYDISTFNPRQFPSTDLQREQKRMSLPKNGVDTWLLACIEVSRLPTSDDEDADSDTWEAVRLKSMVYQHYAAQAGAHAKPGQTKSLCTKNEWSSRVWLL